MEHTLVSIIIATAPGRKKELSALLLSIHKSTYKNFEVLIIDNSNTPALQKSIAQKYKTTRIIHMPNNTGMFALNVGFVNARGEYFFILDDDCILPPDTLKKVMDTFPALPKNTGVITLNIYDPKSKYYSTSHLFQLKSPYVPTIAGGASIIKREVIERVGYFDDTFFCWQHEDDFSIRLLAKGYTIYFARDITLFHDEKIGKVRKKELLFTGRNKVWLDTKHFSFFLLPLIILRDILWILTPLNKPFKATLYSTMGYLWGVLTILSPIRSRSVAPLPIQKIYLKYYLFGKYVGKIVKEESFISTRRTP